MNEDVLPTCRDFPAEGILNFQKQDSFLLYLERVFFVI